MHGKPSGRCERLEGWTRARPYVVTGVNAAECGMAIEKKQA